MSLQLRYEWRYDYYNVVTIKDARSVSLYPYNWSQILQYVNYTNKISIAKGIAIFCDK